MKENIHRMNTLIPESENQQSQKEAAMRTAASTPADTVALNDSQAPFDICRKAKKLIIGPDFRNWLPIRQGEGEPSPNLYRPYDFRSISVTEIVLAPENTHLEYTNGILRRKDDGAILLCIPSAFRIVYCGTEYTLEDINFPALFRLSDALAALKTREPYPFTGTDGESYVLYGHLLFTADCTVFLGPILKGSVCDLRPFHQLQLLKPTAYPIAAALLLPDEIRELEHTSLSAPKFWGELHIGKSVEVNRYILSLIYRPCKVTVSAEHPSLQMIDGSCYLRTDEGLKLLWFSHDQMGDIILPDGVTEICRNAVSGRNKITSITLPDSIRTVGYEAFSHCRSLEKVICHNGAPLIDPTAWQGCDKLLAHHANETEVYCGHTLVKYRGTDESYTVADNVTAINHLAFQGSSASQIHTGRNVKRIGDRAFEGSALEHLILSDSIDQLGAGMVNVCGSLKVVEMPADYPSLWPSGVIHSGKDVVENPRVPGQMIPCKALTVKLSPQKYEEAAKMFPKGFLDFISPKDPRVSFLKSAMFYRFLPKSNQP